MTNAWSLEASILNGTFDEEYPIVKDDAYYERLKKKLKKMVDTSGHLVVHGHHNYPMILIMKLIITMILLIIWQI